MNLDSLNKWLTLVANLGVLIGIIFIFLEISQSNRIAERDGRTELVNQEYDLQSSFSGNSAFAALMVKLSDKDAVLSPLEQFQAESFAQQLILRIANLNISFETGFLSGVPLQRQIAGVILNIERIPGIAPYVAAQMRLLGLDQEGVSPVYDTLMQAVENVD